MHLLEMADGATVRVQIWTQESTLQWLRFWVEWTRRVAYLQALDRRY